MKVCQCKRTEAMFSEKELGELSKCGNLMLMTNSSCCHGVSTHRGSLEVSWHSASPKQASQEIPGRKSNRSTQLSETGQPFQSQNIHPHVK